MIPKAVYRIFFSVPFSIMHTQKLGKEVIRFLVGLARLKRKFSYVYDLMVDFSVSGIYLRNEGLGVETNSYSSKLALLVNRYESTAW